ncbi:NXPE family member 1-like [Glandiceps talaboti]
MSYSLPGAYWRKDASTCFLAQLEDYKKGNTLIVKTHGCHDEFSSAILLIRNPYDGLIAEYSRRHTNHTGYYPFQNLTGEEWENYVIQSIPRWEKGVTCWLTNETPVLVVHYEDLKNDVIFNVDRMLSFLNLIFTEERRRCVLENTEGNFHRKPTPDEQTLLLVRDKAFGKGDYIQVIMEAYDKYGNRRFCGGDFLQGVMTNEKLGTRTGGRVFDYGNGTYSIYFYAAWKGDATITIQLVCYREAILYQNFLLGFDNKRILYYAVFTDGILEETTNCTLANGLGIWQDKCGYASPSSLGKTVLICEKPEKLSCEDLKRVSHQVHDLIVNTAKDMEGMSYLFHGQKLQSAIDNPITIKIKDSNVTTKLPSCGPDLPVSLSSGYWKDNLTFVPLMCRSQQWQKEDVEECLLGKEVHMYGDSTIGQVHKQLSSLEAIPSNLLHLRTLFIKANSGIQGVYGGLFENDFIDRITSCTGVTPVLVINFCFHFGSWTTRIYLDRIFGAKYAILRLFKRCPESIVIIKLGNPRDNADSVQSVHSSNYRFYDMDRMIRRVFGGIGVRFLDIWDLVASHISENDIHMPGPVIMQELHLMLSYICPEMVKKLSK